MALAEHKLADAEIGQDGSELRLLIEIIPQLIWVAGSKGSLEYCNQRLLSYHGRTLEQLQQDGWETVIHPDDRPNAVAAWQSALAEGTPYEIELRLLCGDAGYRWFLVRGTPLRDAAGCVRRWYGTNTDIEDRKRAEAALQTMHTELVHVTRVTMMGELTASIAHELNQPLGAIVNYGHACRRLLAGGPENLAQVDQALSAMVEDAKRASEILARIRALFRKSPPNKEALRVEEVIDDVLAVTRHIMRQRRVTVRAELPGKLPSIRADRVQLQQVLLNLVVNGMDAMSSVEESRCVLVIRGQRDELEGAPAVLLSVQDSGIGLKPEDMDRLFEAFYTTKPHGMGMGLAISRSIVEAHGGRLWAKSNTGPGATFQVVLPADGINLA
jgi:PAS domain S-box-containing protein